MSMEPSRRSEVVVSPAHKSLGKYLRMLRVQKGLTQGDIEKKTGLLRGHISRMENGHVTPMLDTLQRYADALQVPLYSIVYLSQWESVPPTEVSEAALRKVMEPPDEPASQSEAAFLRKLRRVSARLTEADRELILAMAEKFAGLHE
jgi:transcriptional regulator with XRE-family HTH domain